MDFNEYFNIMFGNTKSSKSAIKFSKSNLNESILDKPQDKRADWLFDEKDVLLDSIKNQIFKNLSIWKKGLGFEFDIKDIVLKGSSLGFRYTEDSDVDISVETNIPISKKDEAVRSLPAKVLINGTKHPLDFFMFCEGETLPNKINLDNIYSIKSGWIKKTAPYKNTIPLSYMMRVSSFFLDAWVESMAKAERDIFLYGFYKELSPSSYDYDKEELIDDLDKIKKELTVDVDSLKMIKHMMLSFRREAYAEEPTPFKLSLEFKKSDEKSDNNPHVSPNEILQKAIEKMGYREKLEKIVSDCEVIIEESSEKKETEREEE